MKKLFTLFALVLIFSCHQKKENPLEINPDKLEVVDTFELSGHQLDKVVQSQENPSRGAIKVILSNYTDSAKTFYISVKEK